MVFTVSDTTAESVTYTATDTTDSDLVVSRHGDGHLCRNR